MKLNSTKKKTCRDVIYNQICHIHQMSHPRISSDLDASEQKMRERIRARVSRILQLYSMGSENYTILQVGSVVLVPLIGCCKHFWHVEIQVGVVP